jgi:DNA processing protein
MERRELLMSLHAEPGIGWLTLHRLQEKLDLAELAYMEIGEIAQRAGISRRKAESAHRAAQPAVVERRKRELAACGIGWIVPWDAAYPQRLKEIKDRPWVLYYKGNVRLLQEMCLAIVGSRVPTAYGRRAAEWLSGELAACGLTIVSGLARGIDSCAHRGALKANGGTIAVLGGPLTRVYPPENKALFERIAAEGLLITEAPLTSDVRPGMFPLRNRIIAGISLGVMVVEAAVPSGTSSTVKCAAEYGRELMAVPGSIFSPKSAYPLELIRECGAVTVARPDDVLKALPSFLPLRSGKHGPVREVPLTRDERRIAAALADGPLSIDELLHLSEYTFGHLHSVLLSLTMKHQIEQLPGSVYQLRSFRSSGGDG